MFVVSLWAMINTKERTLRASLYIALVEVTYPYSYQGCSDLFD